MTLLELHEKDVIHAQTGENLGRIDDLVFDRATARIESLILHGRPRALGLLGRDQDLVVPWAAVRSIGADVVMVEMPLPAAADKRRRWR